MFKNSGDCGVVVDSTPQNNANNLNNYVHICTINYLKFVGVDA